jgi:hypothetical protein
LRVWGVEKLVTKFREMTGSTSEGSVIHIMDPGTKMGPGRPKNQSSQNGFKTDVCISLIDMNPTQLEWAKTNTVCKIYHGLFVSPNMEKKDADCTVCTVLTWQLTV